MSLPSVAAAEIVDTTPSKSAERCLGKRRLVLGQILWLAVAICGLSVLAASVAPTLHQLQTVCSVPPCASPQLTPAQARTLHTTLGLSLGAYAVFALALTIVSAFCWVGSGAFFWRKLGQGFVLVFALQGIMQGVLGSNALVANGLVDVLTQAHSPWQVPALLLLGVNQLLFFFVLALFPTGRFAPRWMRWVAVLWTMINALYFAGRLSQALQSSLPPFVPVFLGVIILLISAQAYRYLRVATRIERQQSKWVLFGIIMVNAVQLGFLLPEVAFAPLRQPDSLYGPLANQVVILGYLFAPVCGTIAILRYRLWDIDTIINKALVFGLLTGLLGTVYVGLIIGLESLAGLFGGMAAQNPLVLVISTLAIAVLFLPVRRRIQSIIDRRFYRKKYDAEKTLAAFSATLRNEVDLEQIRAQVLSVVQETMQPAHVSLWLLQPERPSSGQTHSLERHESVQPTRLGGGAQPSERCFSTASQPVEEGGF